MFEANKTMRFLVADDNPATADILAGLLRHEGFEVCVAYDGKAALDGATSFHPDVLILDIRMPWVDGINLAHRLRALPEFRDKLFVAHSGFAEQQDLDQASQAGFDEYLVKPCSLKTLRAIIDEALDRLGPSGQPSDAGVNRKPSPR